MLSFFRLNDPYRLIGVFVILVLLRLPYWFSDLAMTIPQLTWQIVGSRLSQGAMMYDGVWDSLSPFSAGFYWIYYLVFGKSVVVCEILSVLIIFLQSVIFNTIMIRKGAFRDNTYIPAVVYVVLASLYFDFFSLSPVMLGMTFVLLALNNVFGQIEIRAKRDEKLLGTGIYLGIASLIHFPFFVFGLIVLLVFILFTATVRRRYLLFLFGWILPQLLVALYYFTFNSFDLFWSNHVSAWFILETKKYISDTQVLVIIGYVSLLVIMSFIRIARRARLTNYQSRLVRAMFLMGLLSGTIFLLERDRNAYVLLTFVPIAAYFLSHFFILNKKGFFGEMVFLIFLIVTGFYNYISLQESSREGQFNVREYFVEEGIHNEDLRDKRICWLGDKPDVYNHSYAATPFVNWRLSEKIWLNSRRYKNLTIIAHAIERDKPEVIVDPNGLMPQFLKQAPRLARKYSRQGDYYLLKPSN